MDAISMQIWVLFFLYMINYINNIMVIDLFVT